MHGILISVSGTPKRRIISKKILYFEHILPHTSISSLMKDNNEKQDGQQSQTLLISKLPANAFALNYP